MVSICLLRPRSVYLSYKIEKSQRLCVLDMNRNYGLLGVGPHGSNVRGCLASQSEETQTRTLQREAGTGEHSNTQRTSSIISMRGPSKVRRAHSAAGPKTSLKGSRASSIDDHLAHAEVHAPPVARASSSRLPVLTRRIAVVAKLHRLHRVGLALLGE